MSIHDRIDKMTAEADWKEGMVAFRSNTIRELKELKETIKTIKQIIKETL